MSVLHFLSSKLLSIFINRTFCKHVITKCFSNVHTLPHLIPQYKYLFTTLKLIHLLKTILYICPNVQNDPFVNRRIYDINKGSAPSPRRQKHPQSRRTERLIKMRGMNTRSRSRNRIEMNENETPDSSGSRRFETEREIKEFEREILSIVSTFPELD